MKPVDALLLASAAALAIFTSSPSAFAGETPYNPHPTSQQQLLDACSRDVVAAQAGLTMTHAANRPKAEEYLKQARAAMKAGDATTCNNRVQDALHWEQ